MGCDSDVENTERILLLEVHNVFTADRSIVTSRDHFSLTTDLNLELWLFATRGKGFRGTEDELVISSGLNLETPNFVILRLGLTLDSLRLRWYDGETSWR
jgi:hypothetical protein